ncbi:MAG: hypothetical protein ACT4NU_07410 [Chromatiales bacterium]
MKKKKLSFPSVGSRKYLFVIPDKPAQRARSGIQELFKTLDASRRKLGSRRYDGVKDFNGTLH